ncbi:MAG TPA: TonB-dependent receptor plug domain-containing protein, partial [Flavisolibacter sp.]|nr:TonB-dependent receptor plug domain-containing protein [Flavisolibacter sp.]
FIMLLLTAVMSVLYTAAQQPLRLYVYDAATFIPLEDVLAESADRTAQVLSNASGFLKLSLPATMEDSLVLSRVGYKTRKILPGNIPVLNGSHAVALEPAVTSLDEIKVSTTGTVYKTISDLDIHLRPINHAQEVLRMVPGLFIGQHAGGGKSEQIFLRGFDLDHGTDIRLTVDGMPVNMVSHAHGQGYADLHFLIPELIEQVNFAKGPYNAEKGNFTTAGYVDFKTKNFLDKSFLKTEAGSFNTFRTTAGINLLPGENTQRRRSLYLAGEASYTKGFFTSPQNFNRFNGLLKYYGALTLATRVTAILSAFSSGWQASGQIPERAVRNGRIGYYGAIDDTEGGTTSRYNSSVELTTELAHGATIRNQVFFSKYDFLLYSNFTFFKEDPVNGDQIRQKERRKIVGYNGTYSKASTLGRLPVKTVAGLQIQYDDIADLELSRTAAKITTTAELKRGHVRELTAGGFAAQTVSFSKKLSATLGGRADFFKNTYNDLLESNTRSSQSLLVSPKLNVDYKVNNQVQLYWYNGRGFHSNDTRVAVDQGGRKVLPPAWGTDIGGIFKASRKVVFHGAMWYLFLQQEFVYVGDEGVVEAGGRTVRKGIDLSVRYEPFKHVFIDGDISLAKPRALDASKGESYLPLAPSLTSAGGITYKKENGINGSLRYRFMGDRPANEDYSVKAQGYFIADAALNYTRPKWEGGFSVQNLFNTRWKETQFNTESRLQDEPQPVTEIHFTPGTPVALRLSFSYFF